MLAPSRATWHVVIGLAAILIFVVSGYVIVANSGAYRTARQYVATHPKAIAVLGNGIDTRLKWGGRFRVDVSQPYRWMRLVMAVKGGKASGTATVEISKKSDADWAIEKAELSAPHGDVVLVEPPAQ